MGGWDVVRGLILLSLLLTYSQDVVMPASMSDPMKQLLTGLLQKDPGSRLGCRGRGSEELKEMDFFKTTNWDDVMDKKVCVCVCVCVLLLYIHLHNDLYQHLILCLT